MSAETRAFTLHPEMVNAIITKQSGSAQKALLELVMNSVDAGATSVSLDLNSNGFVLADNGKGMASREEILKYWETFAQPHEAGDATFGVHRIGRGQVMALASTEWRTNAFTMTVDHKNRPGEYQLSEDQPHQSGMKITGNWYRAIKLPNVIFELKKLCRFIDVDLVLNGKPISIRPNTKEWTHSNAEAWFDLDHSSDQPLIVYNLGAYVADFPHTKFGLSGTIVSRQQLSLNFARNDILPDCKVWSKIEDYLRGIRNNVVLNGPLTRASDRAVVLEMLSRGEVNLAAVRDKPLITTVEGKVVTINDVIATPEFAVVPSLFIKKAEALARSTGAMMLKQGVATALGVTTPEQMIETLQIIGKRDNSPVVPPAPVKPIDIKSAYNALVADDRVTETVADLTKRELAAMEALRLGNPRLAHALRTHGFGAVSVRPLIVGRLKGAAACTDGQTIVFDSNYLKSSFQSTGGFHAVVLTLIHEYGHQARHDQGVHDFEFYEAFHNILERPVLDVIFTIVEQMITAHNQGKIDTVAAA
jgi:hypothetical protein